MLLLSAETESEVDEVHITGQRTEQAAPAETWTALPTDRIRRIDARSVAEVLRRAPGALVQTNSRGQTLVVLRNAGERQVTVFFDGAPLEIPWDHRIDLGLIPATAVGRAEVARGPLSNRYGPNISGGAIFLSPPEPAQETAATLGLEGGQAGHLRAGASLSFWPTEAWSALVAVESTEWSGEPLAASLPFSQASDQRRTNTDARRTSALGRLAWTLAQTELAVSVLYGAAAFGIAPEGHLDPAFAPVRYWRYPDTDLAMVIASMETASDAWAADAVVWGQAFRQTVDSFTSAEYTRIAQSQRDTDRSLGARARVAGTWGVHRLSVSATANLSTHDEARVHAGEAPIAEDRFSHGLWSTGADYLFRASRFRLRVGAGIDGLEPIDTAGRPSTGGIRGWNASLGSRIDLGSTVTLRGAIGSRARLPTPRELFGTALDRFVVNASLRPERTTSIEMGVAYAGSAGRLELVPFASWTDDTLDQELVIVDGALQRRRVNLDSSRVFGLELIGALEFASWLRCAGQLMISDARRRQAQEDRLTERPAVQAFAELVWGGPDGPELSAELVARSAAYSLGPEGLREVPGAALFNLRGAYRILNGTGGDLEIYGRVDNVFDARLEPQLGLPEPGRWFRVGVVLRL